MQARQPVYRDLLEQGISEKQLTDFLTGLSSDSDHNHPVTFDDEIDNPVYCNKTGAYYHTALCYATFKKDVDIVKALLKIGAHPNVYSENVSCGSALLLAIQYLPATDEIFSLLLATTDVNIFVLRPLKTAFNLAKGNTLTISRLLKADQQITFAYSDEEINAMAANIAESKSENDTNYFVCQNLAKLSEKTDEKVDSIKRIVNDELIIATPGAPLNEIIFSYLFFKKSNEFNQFQCLYRNAPAITEERKPDTKKSASNCSMM